MKKINLYLVDDQQTIIDSLYAVLNDTRRDEYVFNIVGHATGIGEALADLKTRPVDVLILDVEMPGTDGLKGIELVRKARPDCQIVMLSIHKSWSIATRAIGDGANGYVVKNSRIEVIIEGIIAVFENKIYIDTNIVRGRELVQFEKREMEIIRLTLEEHTTEAIGQRLNLSGDQVETYRRRIMARMEVKSLPELALYALENRLCPEFIEVSAPDDRWIARPKTDGPIRVFIADDHDIVVEGLKLVLTKNPRYPGLFEIAGTALNGEEALREIVRISRAGAAPDVVLLDVEMPVMDGLNTTRNLLAVLPAQKIILMTLHPEHKVAAPAQAAGAKAVLSKHLNRQQIINTIFRVVADEPIRFPVPENPLNLTGQELEIVRMIVKGHTNQKIAARLQLAVSRVDHLRRNIMEKMNTNNVVGMVKYAYRYNLHR